MLKTLVALAAGVAVLSTSGCCWPLHGGHHGGRHRGYDDRWESQRPDPPRYQPAPAR